MEIILSSILNFVVVVFVLAYFGKKPVEEFFAVRSKSIGTLLSEAQSAFARSHEMLQLWDSKWKASEAHAKQLQTESAERLAKFRESTLTFARNSAKRIREEAHLIGKSDVEKAKTALQNEIIAKSISTARQYFKSHLDEKDRHRLVTSYMEKDSNGS